MRHALFTLALASAALTFTGCGNKPTDSTEVAENANEAKIDSGQTAVMAEDKSDKKDESEFLAKAAEGGMFEVEAGKLAEKQAVSPEAKAFAKMMVEEHGKAGEDVKKLAAQKNVSLPVALGNDKANKLEELSGKTGKDFDQMYLGMMVDDHEKDLDFFKHESEKGEDPDFKALATKMVPIVQHHLDMVKPLKDKADKM